MPKKPCGASGSQALEIGVLPPLTCMTWTRADALKRSLSASESSGRVIGHASGPVRDDVSTSPSAGGVTDVAVTAADTVPRLLPTAQTGRLSYLVRKSL